MVRRNLRRAFLLSSDFAIATEPRGVASGNSTGATLSSSDSSSSSGYSSIGGSSTSSSKSSSTSSLVSRLNLLGEAPNLGGSSLSSSELGLEELEILLSACSDSFSPIADVVFTVGRVTFAGDASLSCALLCAFCDFHCSFGGLGNGLIFLGLPFAADSLFVVILSAVSLEGRVSTSCHELVRFDAIAVKGDSARFSPLVESSFFSDGETSRVLHISFELSAVTVSFCAKSSPNDCHSSASRSPESNLSKFSQLLSVS
mmetsp:Transcript_2329/g.3264  ORF Transcript_2329/g.3264 Transcript_2329/m.3264 type:complete len:258 (+) Transcript_2329:343-1116(+)